MDPQQIVSAIQIAADPSQDRSLQAQAVEFLNVVRGNARLQDHCAVALTLFLEQNPDSSRKHSSHVRVFALQLLDDYLDASIEPLPVDTFRALEQAFVQYIQSEYIQGPAETHAPYIRNKFSHTLALLFLRTYIHQWHTFFSTIFSLLRPAPSDGSSSNGSGLPPINGHVSVLFLRLLLEISGEVHDQTIKGARTWNHERQERDSTIRHTIRELESSNMNQAVLTIIAEAEERLVKLRQEAPDPARNRERAGLEEVVELGVKAYASYIPWVDINLTVNEHTVPLIFRLLADLSSPVRQATAHALLKIISKGLKEPSDKLQLIRVLSLGEVLETLERKSREERKPGDQNEAEELYRESLGKLASGLGLELVDLAAAENLPPEGRTIVEQLTAQLFPVALQFLADEYDDTASTVFPLFTGVFLSYKKAKKLNPQGHLTLAKRQFLTSTLKVIIEKMKWDPEASADEDEFDDMDEEERGDFEKMRHDLRGLMDSILTIDEELVTDAVRSIALSTLSTYQSARASGTSIPWQDAELAVHLIFLYGELRPKTKLLFVQVPPEIQADRIKRKNADYAQFPLTSHGELMFALVKSGISSFPHIAVRSQFFESVGRYLEFFKIRTDCIMDVLLALVDERGMHQPKKNRRGRVFYIFYKFIGQVRSDLNHSMIPEILNGIQDLLELDLELPSPDGDSHSSSSAGSSPTPDQDAAAILEEAVRAPGLFDNQLYLFETMGTLISLVGEDEQVAYLQTVTNPLLGALSQTLQTPMRDSKDVLPVFKAHHLIQALASVVKGFPDVPAPSPNYVPPKRLEVFKQVAEAILVSLDAMKGFKVIRDATRFAFTRIIAAAGPAVANYIPTLTAALLAADTEASEIVEIFSFLGLVFHHHLGDEVSDMLDQMIVPLTTKVSALMAAPADGTDSVLARQGIEKAYLDFILVIMSGPLYAVFISSRNAAQFETLVSGIIQFASNTGNPVGQKTAFAILSRFIMHFGAPEGSAVTIKNKAKVSNTESIPAQYVPGFERVIYERLIPMGFDVPSSPGFNIKDGVAFSVVGEIGLMLKAAHKARGQEVLDYLANTFLPSKNSPPQTTLEFVTKLQDLEAKEFRKFFSDFVRASSQPQPTSQG